MHKHNIIYGDIKLNNIYYGNLSSIGKTNYRTIGFIDFGNSSWYKEKNKIIRLTTKKEPRCRREYASLNILEGKTFSWRDDLESMFYVIIEAFTKKLPWERLDEFDDDFHKNNNNFEKSSKFESIKINSKNQKILTKEVLIFLHKNLTKEQICFSLPEEFIKIYDIIKKLKYEQKTKL